MFDGLSLLVGEGVEDDDGSSSKKERGVKRGVVSSRQRKSHEYRRLYK
jgi:hypothetical protein